RPEKISEAMARVTSGMTRGRLVLVPACRGCAAALFIRHSLPGRESLIRFRTMSIQGRSRNRPPVLLGQLIIPFIIPDQLTSMMKEVKADYGRPLSGCHSGRKPCDF